MTTQTNPNSLRNLRHDKKAECEHCEESFRIGNIKKHTVACSKNPKNLKKCPVCKEMYFPKYVKKGKPRTTCSISCSNTYFRSGKNNPNYNDESYRNICFEHHEKKCVICGEDKIVEVHHWNNNHDDNDPKNLVPLCPTHHKYMHSRWSVLINEKINEYKSSKLSG